MSGSGRPVWLDETSAEDIRTLCPGCMELPRKPDVLVIGGGVVGLAIAATCARRGIDVALVERDDLASGASGRAAGGLAPDAHPQAGPQWHALARRSLELHRELDAQWQYGLENLDLRVVPDLVIPNQARVNPLEMCAALARRVDQACSSVRVLEWSDDFRRVTTTMGDIEPGVVVFATGAERTPSVVKGHLIATEPAAFDLGEIVATIDGYFLCLQLPSGRIVAGGTKEPDDATPDVIGGTVEGIRTKLVEYVPRTRDLSVSHAWTCFRPKSPDELPVIDRVGERAYAASGFFSTGILMAPVAGEIVADALQGAELPDAFSARRFR